MSIVILGEGYKKIKNKWLSQHITLGGGLQSWSPLLFMYVPPT
jgi:hypothetical protein